MSTNAVIRVEGFKVAELYKHWDGHSRETLPWLKEFNERISAEENVLPSEKFAQLLRSSAKDGEKFRLDPSIHTGWGVLPQGRGSYQYLYVLKADGTVSVRR